MSLLILKPVFFPAVVVSCSALFSLTWVASHLNLTDKVLLFQLILPFNNLFIVKQTQEVSTVIYQNELTVERSLLA